MKLEFSCDAGTDVEFHASAENVQGDRSWDFASSGVSASTAAVEIVGAPAAGETRRIRSVQLRNSGVSTRTVTVRVDVSGTDREVRVVSLLTHESLDYNHGTGWTHYGADGDAHVSGVALSDTLSGTLDVTGAVTMDSTLDVGGAIAGATSITAADLIATDDLTVGDDAAIVGALDVGGATTCVGLTASGDIDAAGGFPISLGPWVQDNVAANQSAVALKIGATAAPQAEAVVWRAGSLRAILASFTVAPAGTDLVVSVFKNGSLLHATAILTVAAGAALGRVASFSKDTANLSFAAGDRVGIAVTTGAGWTATTSDLAVWALIES
jgi:hypothetical protein